ncbi:MAG: glutaredoxin 3 [Hyphomicrobiaceae bacterium]|jgi:glutaredoxin 3
MLLQSKNTEFEEVDLSQDFEARRGLHGRTGHRTFPQIFIGEDFVGGCDELFALDRTGRLDALLA